MFDKLLEKKEKLIKQLEDYYYFLKGWDLDALLENYDKLNKKEKKFFKEIKQQLDDIDLIINSECF